MRRTFAAIALAVGMFGVSVRLAAGPEPAAIAVDLKSFKFKVNDKIAELFGYNEEDGKLFFYTNGPAEATVKVPADGDYEIAVKASCDSAKKERAKFTVAVDGRPVGKETLLSADDAKEYKLTTPLKAGDRKLAIAFTNDVYKESEYDRNLYVHAVTLKRLK